ncbi:MAG: hypothetical protein RLZZ416_261 [Candidatus Parcubacteria bacterium]|jgi:hypothetical protein
MNDGCIAKKMHERSQRGFTLLLAALIASIVLSLGAAIFAIAKKEVILSSLGRDSQFAFYVADTAAECALYWDFRYGYFGKTIPDGFNLADLKCDGQCLSASGPSCGEMSGRANASHYTMTSDQMNFFQDASPAGGYCAEVRVEKCDGPFDSNGACTPSNPAVVHTIIHANGYSTNCASILSSPRSLQRSVELHY